MKLNKIIIFTFIILSFSCTKKDVVTNQSTEENKLSEKDKLLIGFSIDTLAIERWQRDLDIFINKAKELGADVIVQNAGNNINEQNRQLLYLMEKQIDVAIIIPKEAGELTDTIQKLKNKNIPVIAYDRLIVNSNIDLYMTIDSEKVGESMAQGLLNATKGTNWFYILGPEEDYNMTLIKEGIAKYINNTNITVSHLFYTDSWNYDLSHQEMNRLLANDQIPDAIVCGNDAIADSVIQSISKYSPDKEIAICGQDADIIACKYIIQGKQSCTVYKPIPKLAELAAEYAVKLAKKENLQIPYRWKKSINNGYAEIPGVWIEPILVTKENLDKVVIDSGFHPATSIYGN
ncbi:MAG: sugar ABC transporter substrate-binding protein [Treponema bryantii]|nr:sugar ABC transporter substrate-binding protein [Treponema bryantii]